MRISSLALLVASALLLHDNARADWVQNGIPIRLTTAQGSGPQCAPDGAGGAIMCWTDNRLGTYDIFAQRVDGFGNTMWTINGVLVCNAAGDQTSPLLISDGFGGVIITWNDGRNMSDADVYVQRLNSAGSVLWTANGVGLCTLPQQQIVPSLLADGSGGAIVAWQDARPGSNYDVYARRINGAGTALWTVNGNPICVIAGNQTRVGIVPDGAGGAIMAWADARLGPTDIYAQRVNSAGTVQWAANGLVVSNAPGNQSAPQIVSDGVGGAVIVFADEQISVNDDIYGQRINGAGATQWLGGVSFCTEAGTQSNLELVSDGAGGAIATWQDERANPGVEVDLYAQRVNLNGAALWDYNGVPVCVGAGVPSQFAITTDGQGGAIIAWGDTRLPGDEDVFAQRVTTGGLMLWAPNGMYVGAALGDQQSASLAPDGTGGVIAAFNDGRGGGGEIYAQRVEPRYGYWGRPEPTAISAADNPSDQGGFMNVRWDASQLDLFFSPGISLYSIWRSTDFVMQQVAANLRTVKDPSELDANFHGITIWEEITPSGPVYWEFVGSVPAQFLDTYSFLAPTRQDGPTHYFKVIALESPSPPSRAWESGVVSGASVDNLAPPAPLQLSGSATPWDITLTWQSGGPIPDFSQYVIYRGVGFVLPLPQYRIGVDTQTHHVDDSVPNGYLRYIVTAMDTHGNESAPSNEWSPSGLTPVPNTPAITRLTVRPNRPNPFSDMTSFEIGLPSATDVTVEVFDVAGRRVAASDMKGARAGWSRFPFSGQDEKGRPLASGVYFFKVTAAAQTVTQKMVIAR